MATLPKDKMVSLRGRCNLSSDDHWQFWPGRQGELGEATEEMKLEQVGV